MNKEHRIFNGNHGLAVLLVLALAMIAGNAIAQFEVVRPETLQGYIRVQLPDGKMVECQVAYYHPLVPQTNATIVLKWLHTNNTTNLATDSVVWQGSITRISNGQQVRNPVMVYRAPNFQWVPKDSWFDFEKIVFSNLAQWQLIWFKRTGAWKDANWKEIGRATSLMQNDEEPVWARPLKHFQHSVATRDEIAAKKIFVGNMQHRICGSRFTSQWNATLFFEPNPANNDLPFQTAYIMMEGPPNTRRPNAYPPQIAMRLQVLNQPNDSVVTLETTAVDDIMVYHLREGSYEIGRPRYRYQFQFHKATQTIAGTMRHPSGSSAVFALRVWNKDSATVPNLYTKATTKSAEDISHKAVKEAVAPTPAEKAIQRLAATRLDTMASIRAEADTVMLQWYDNATIDGDSISLFLNDTPVVINELLSAKPITLLIPKTDKPILIKMVADNLGSIPPNTAVLVVTQGRRQQRFSIQSDMSSTGSVLLYW